MNIIIVIILYLSINGRLYHAKNTFPTEVYIVKKTDSLIHAALATAK